MEREEIKLKLIDDVIDQIIDDIMNDSFEPLEEMFTSIVNESNLKYLIAYLDDENLVNKYNELLK